MIRIPNRDGANLIFALKKSKDFIVTIQSNSKYSICTVNINDPMNKATVPFFVSKPSHTAQIFFLSSPVVTISGLE
jgi:hypothetical protein